MNMKSNGAVAVLVNDDEDLSILDKIEAEAFMIRWMNFHICKVQGG